MISYLGSEVIFQFLKRHVRFVSPVLLCPLQVGLSVTYIHLGSVLWSPGQTSDSSLANNLREDKRKVRQSVIT